MADKQSIQLRTKMLGALLRKARLASGKSLKDAGGLIGVSGSVMSSYERGRRGISLPELELLAYQLNTPLSHFLKPSKSESGKKAEFNPTVMVSLRQHFIGATIRAQRESAEMTQRDLAKASGVSASRVSRYEQGDRPIPVAELEAISDALGAELGEYQDTRGPVGEWEAVQQAFESFLRLPADLRAFIGKEESEPYLRMAQRMSDLPVEKVRTIGEGFLEIAL
jgi:transcriptional regulator with XRE-family HTH domain